MYCFVLNINVLKAMCNIGGIHQLDGECGLIVPMITCGFHSLPADTSQ